MNVMNILWAFNIDLPKDPATGVPIPLDEDDTTDVNPLFAAKNQDRS